MNGTDLESFVKVKQNLMGILHQVTVIWVDCNIEYNNFFIK